MSNKKSLKLALAVAAAVAAPGAFATNGMNMQGYGPIAYGMGGASMAYDNGTAATMNNPATLGLMAAGDRLDVAVGYLGPKVDISAGGGTMLADSSANTFWMPAVGWARKSGALTYGFGMFAQGGMGATYGSSTFAAAGSGQEVRSELGVGRLIFPIAYNVSPDLVVGGSIDYVWAGLDLKMAMPGATMAGMVTSCSGAGCAALGGLGAAPWVRIDFSNSDDMTGQAQGAGFAGKLGLTYKVSPTLSIGASYHTKTSMGDLETESADTTMSAFGAGTVSTGKVAVNDFQWPATMALGVAWNASENLMVAADVKQIKWADVMKDFKMTYSSSDIGGAGAATVSFALPQNWEDQTVLQLGVQYKASDGTVLRAGINKADSAIPDAYVNPLFPAIMEDHYTVGAGFPVGKTSSFDVGIAYAPQVSATNSSGVTSNTGGKSMQLMYSNRF